MRADRARVSLCFRQGTERKERAYRRRTEGEREKKEKFSPKIGEEQHWDGVKDHKKKKGTSERAEATNPDMVERKEFPVGMRVCITGGIYKKQGYSGEITGSTPCMVYVAVPGLPRALRLRRTSVESAEAETEERTTEDPPTKEHGSVAEVWASDEVLRTSLTAACVRLTRHGFHAGEKDIHEMVDAVMTAVAENRK
jgi:hypothetical protein